MKVALTLLVLCSLLVLFPKINIAKAYSGETITINADGSISPSDAPIIRNGNTYTLTGNITIGLNYSCGIWVERDNILLNGSNHKIEGWGLTTPLSQTPSDTTGVELSGPRVNVTIINVETEDFWTGIGLDSSSHCTIANCSVSDNYVGVYLSDSNDNFISENNISDPIWVSFSSNNMVVKNRATGINLARDSMNNTVAQNTVTHGGIILSYNANNNTISGNEITANDAGIWVSPGDSGQTSNYNSIIGNSITNNSCGVYLDSLTYSSIVGNNITENGCGIRLYELSGNNTIVGNNITNNGYGIYFGYDQDTPLASSSNNTIYDNRFVNNTEQVYDYAWNHNCMNWYGVDCNISYAPTINFWDNGSVGNYWSNYTGTGNTPYVIDANNQDNHPLGPYEASSPTSSPTWLVLAEITLAIVVIVTVVGLPLLAYYAKVKKRTQSNETAKAQKNP